MKQTGRGVLKTLLQECGSCPARPATLADPGMEDRHSSRSCFWVFFRPPLSTVLRVTARLEPKLIPLLPTSLSSSLNPRRGKDHHSASKTLTENQGEACFSRKEAGGRQEERVPGEMFMAPHYSAGLLRWGGDLVRTSWAQLRRPSTTSLGRPLMMRVLTCNILETPPPPWSVRDSLQ